MCATSCILTGLLFVKYLAQGSGPRPTFVIPGRSEAHTRRCAMKSTSIPATGLLALIFFVVATSMGTAQANNAFGFNSPNISGFPTGAAELTGGGAYNPATGFVHSGGGFRCIASVQQGPLNGCLAGQGIRWDTAALLSSTTFKCTGATSEPLQTANTSANTVVLVADFYRQGDGNDESFTAKMIVSEVDLAPDVPGVQNVWIQGVGCGSAIVNFNTTAAH